MSNYYPPGYLRAVKQDAHDERVKARGRQFQIMLCGFSVENLCTEFSVKAPTIGRWRRGETRPGVVIMKSMIERMRTM